MIHTPLQGLVHVYIGTYSDTWEQFCLAAIANVR